MIIRNTAKSPSYGTDQVAHDLSATLSTTRSFEPARAEQIAASAPEPLELEILYPNLFPVQSVQRPSGLSETLAEMFNWALTRIARAT